MSKRKSTATDALSIADEVVDERLRQDEVWGTQDHECVYSWADRQRFAGQADHWKQRNDARVRQGRITWDGILLEEVFEALGEGDRELRRAELIQVAAVAMAWVECMDRNAPPLATEVVEPVAVESDEGDAA